MKQILINAIGFNIGWFGCVLSSRWGVPLAAIPVVAILLAIHLFVTMPRARRRAELASVAIVAMVGIFVDSGMLVAGVLRFDGTTDLTPTFLAWIACFWLNFAMTLSVALRWLARMPLIAAILGAVSAPGTYYFGARLSQLDLGTPNWVSFTALAVEWAILLPAFFVITHRLRPDHRRPPVAPAGGAEA